MAFKKVSENKGSSLPFFDVWIKEQSEEVKEFLSDKLMEPKHIKAVTSGKGYILNFDDEFSVFVWKNSTEGRVIKKMLHDECGNLLLLQFQKGKKDLSYALGFDDDVECTITEDKYEEDVYFSEATTELPPIAPEENRKFFMQLPTTTAPITAIRPLKIKQKKTPSGAMGEAD